MRKIEAVCPYCAKAKTVETIGTATNLSLKCAHCSKSWDEDLSETGSLAKSAPAPSDGMAAVRQRLIELGKVVDDYIARQAATRPAKFKPSGGDQAQEATVLKFVAGAPGGVMLQIDATESAPDAPAFVTKAADNDAAARAELQKALANGMPVTSPEYVRVGESGAPARFQPVQNIAVTNAFGGGTVEKTFTPAPAERRPFQPNGNTDLSKADAAVRHALANGKKV